MLHLLDAMLVMGTLFMPLGQRYLVAQHYSCTGEIHQTLRRAKPVELDSTPSKQQGDQGRGATLLSQRESFADKHQSTSLPA